MYLLKFSSKDELLFSSVGQVIQEKNWIHYCTSLELFEIIIGVVGTFFIEEEGKQYEINSGDVLFLKPNLVHKGYKPCEQKVEFYWICFHCKDYEILEMKVGCDELSNLISSKSPTGDIIVFNFSNYLNVPNIIIILQQLLHVFALNYYTTKINQSIFMTLLFELTQQQISRYDSLFLTYNNDKKFNKIMEWIRINSYRHISLDEISREFNYCKNYFTKLFKLKTGMTINSYITNERISKAKQYLCQTEYSIKQISYMVGYDNDKYFLKLFKKHESITPLEFRNANFKTRLNK